MFDSKSKAVKIGGYIIIGFFTLIIVISFGMPDFMSKLGMDDNVVAVVNGEKIYRLDFIRYRDNMSRQVDNADKKEVQDSFLNSMIMRKLILQEADKIGIQVSEKEVMRSIKNIQAFKNEDGKFDNKILESYLSYNHLGLSDFFILIKEDLMLDELRNMILLGTGVSPDEINIDYAIENSSFQIKYCYVSSKDIDKRFKDKISVEENEIDEELRKSKDEIKDPVSDRKRIKDKLEKEKLDEYKNELIDEINRFAQEKKSFNEAKSLLGGKVFVSNIFKIGDPVKSSDESKVLYSISNSSTFRNSLLSLSKGQSSEAIDSFDGIYIFTPVKNEFSLTSAPDKEYDRIESDILYQKNNSIYISMMTSLRERSKIIKNLKFN